MAMPTVCQTPGAMFRTSIHDDMLLLTVEFGRDLNLDEAEAILLEANVHNAVELVLAKYYTPARNPASEIESQK